MKCCAVIVAAGRGTRLGASVPKAFLELAGRPLFAHSLAVFDSHAAVAQIVIVAPADRLKETARLAADCRVGTQLAVVAGGGERWESVRNGVSECAPGIEWVLVHDAARPFVTEQVVDSLLETAASYRAAVTVTEVVDTIRRFDGDRAGDTVDRHSLVRVGTPQLFSRGELLRGFGLAQSLSSPPTDEAVLMQHLGIDVGIAWGDPINFKITTPRDMELARLLAERQGLADIDAAADTFTP